VTRLQKLGLYASAIPIGIGSSIIFPKNVLLAMGFAGGFIAALSFLPAYIRNFRLWLCVLMLAAIHFIILYKLKISIFPEMQRGASILTIFAIILIDGTCIYFTLKACMHIMRIAPTNSVKD
jgi:hypothetical protein